MFRLSHEFRKRHEFRAHVREINDPSRMVTYFARIINFAWHRKRKIKRNKFKWWNLRLDLPNELQFCYSRYPGTVSQNSWYRYIPVMSDILQTWLRSNYDNLDEHSFLIFCQPYERKIWTQNLLSLYRKSNKTSAISIVKLILWKLENETKFNQFF